MQRGQERLGRLEELDKCVTPWIGAQAKVLLVWQTCELHLRSDYPSWEMERRPLHQNGWGDLIARHIYLENDLLLNTQDLH
jgi:hypothetical protein